MSEEICIEPQYNDGPRTLRDPREQERRKAMLTQSHIAPLVGYTAKLRGREGVEVPEFDPLDGGIDAQVLFLFEKPGPMTALSVETTMTQLRKPFSNSCSRQVYLERQL